LSLTVIVKYLNPESEGAGVQVKVTRTESFVPLSGVVTKVAPGIEVLMFEVTVIGC